MNALGQQKQTIRNRILGVIEATARPLTGKEVARAAGIPYKPTIDALNKLHDYGKVRRIGAKFTARCTVNRSEEIDDLLTRIMLSISRPIGASASNKKPAPCFR